jgi:hypothetical protein
VANQQRKLAREVALQAIRKRKDYEYVAQKIVQFVGNSWKRKIPRIGLASFGVITGPANRNDRVP